MFSRVLQRVCRQSYVNNQNVQYILPVCRGCIASRFSSSEVADGSKDSATSPGKRKQEQNVQVEEENPGGKRNRTSKAWKYRSPIWLKGGKAHPPRGGRTYWYVLPAPIRAWGLRVAMSIKHAQDNLCIVDSLDIPSSDPQYLEDIAKERYWGESVLFVDE
ncbi:putative 39S ribosomal protein L4, mitochondrial isoform X1 [Apostichopus japonicus]|uniref:Large ribosomal subunit protein uL4m n=1 Tax=Stichopus japonicus TaxID=307972 RepID=A0A2G8LD39_STIJA|nr:putative 39S ribosomal protein L4, mitochondrial isoform X1 [Apostichopus japonicus]